MASILANWRKHLPTIVNVVGATLFGLGSLILTAHYGAGFTSIVFGLIGVLAWFALYIAWGLTQVRGISFLVVERAGQYWETYWAGWVVLCLPPFFDKPAANGGKGDHEYREIDIIPKAEEQIDFLGGGTGALRGKITYRVAQPGEDPMIGNEGPRRWTYVTEDTPGQILSIVLGFLRQRAQEMTVEEANVNLDGLSKKGRDSGVIKDTLANMGIVLRPENGIVIRDIAWSEETMRARGKVLEAQEQVLAAEQRVEEAKTLITQQANIGKGYVASVREIHKELKKLDPNATVAEAVQIYQTAEAMKTLREKSGDITLVSPDIGRATTSIIVPTGHHTPTVSPTPSTPPATT